MIETMNKFLRTVTYAIWILILIISLGVIAFVGDNIVMRSTSKMKRAISDSCTHGLIGSVSWLVVCVYFKRPVYISLCEVLVGGFFSSFIDIDHFIAARSFKLKDALNLSTRPFLHCSSLPFFMIMSMFVCANVLELRHMETLSWILLVAFTSHHVRDATRHGFWLWPFGSTVPLQYFLYILITMFFPLIVIFLMNSLYISPKTSKYIIEI